MDKKDLLTLLNNRLKEIESVISSMETTGIIHEIEIDLMLSKIRLMYEEVKQLSGYNTSVKLKEEVPDEVDSAIALGEEKEIAPVPEKAEEAPETEINFREADYKDQEPEEVEEDIIPDSETLKEDEGTVEEKKIEMVELGATESAADQPVNEEIQHKHSKLKAPDGKLLTGIKMQAVDDIMVAIGLNDRFLFIRELFNNDPGLLKSTINELNKKSSWEDAIAYLDENFDWDPEDPTLMLFLSFVKRRFI
jgi:hypothetical protein